MCIQMLLVKPRGTARMKTRVLETALCAYSDTDICLTIISIRTGNTLMNFFLCVRFYSLLSVTSTNKFTNYVISMQRINRLKPNDPRMGRTAPLTSKRCILYIYSTNRGTEYFKHALYSPFFSLQNAVCFIMLTCLVPVLFTFYIQGVLKLKKK